MHRGKHIVQMKIRKVLTTVVLVALVAVTVSGQAAYQPKFKGDPARSDSEAAALGYIRTFLRAQRMYKKKNGHYATTLMELAKTGSFTKRMASSTDRGDYTVKFRAHKEKDTFEITMVPKQEDSTHRSFFSDEQGKIRVDETKEADESSELLKAD
jgi:type II secretory pathway pseudopilin PulG